MTTPETTPDTTPESAAVTPPEPDNSTPLFPPGYLLLVSAAGFLLAVVHLLTQVTFGAPGWGGLAVGILTLFAWAMMAPEQAKSMVTGRAAQFGATAVIVTVVFLVALVMIYGVIASLKIRQDVSNFEIFSLTDQARDIVRTLAADPTTPKMKIIGFYATAQGANQDRIAVLLDDFVQTSNGRITYEFINPDRQPQLATQYNAQNGQFIVVPLDETDAPIVDKAETAASADQQQLIDAMVKASSSGDFRVYYTGFEDGVDMSSAEGTGGTILKTDLTDSYGWTVEEVALFDPDNVLVAPPDPKPDGEVLLIPGGGTPLADEQLKLITDYLDKGGDMVLLADLTSQGGASLATAENFSNYLFEHYGIRFRDDIVYDLNNAATTPFDFVAAGFSEAQFITRDYSAGEHLLLFEYARSIEVAPEAIPDVTVTVISKTTPAGFARPALQPGQEVTQEDLTMTEGDLQGEIPIAAVAENTKTGSRIVLFGSDAMIQNKMRRLDSAGVKNLDAANRALFWAGGYDEYRQIPSLELVRPQQVPLILTDTETRAISLVSVLLLPFGVLGFGIWQWWMRRERAPAA